jgi:hypothetical protein
MKLFLKVSIIMEIDLNLDNYDLSDLLNLFSLKQNFDINDLKNAKKIVIKLHPDKCGLDKTIFLFYCKAFRIIKNIYDFRNNKQDCLNRDNSKIEYLEESDDDKGKQLLVENLMKKDKKYFHTWFNETFEKINIVDEERKTGYGDWFKGDEDIDNEQTSYNMMHQKINQKKQTMSALIKKNDIQEINMRETGGYQQLDNSAPESYSSDVFSKLQYDDLKKAHTETVVPVCENDYINKKKFNNVESLRIHRDSERINNKPLSQNESNKYLNNKNKVEEENNIRMAYKITKQQEEVEKANQGWWNSLRLLK